MQGEGVGDRQLRIKDGIRTGKVKSAPKPPPAPRVNGGVSTMEMRNHGALRAGEAAVGMFAN